MCFPDTNNEKIKKRKLFPDITRTSSSKVFVDKENKKDPPESFSEKLYNFLRDELNSKLNIMYLLH